MRRAVFTVALFVLSAPASLSAQQSEFKQAGVCSRCHVVSVLEWQISGHTAAETTCSACHGASRAHVANERNEISPDRIPRGDAVDGLCKSCHTAGCPSTAAVQGCASCHNAHSLTKPDQIEAYQGDRSSHPIHSEVARLNEFRSAIDRAEGLVAQRKWRQAKAAFEQALSLRPGDPRALARVRFCERRLAPAIPGFEIVGEEFDPVSGLARRVRIAGLGIEMLLVPAGEFDLGADHLEDSRPVHTVAIDAFYLGSHEVTQDQWQALMVSNPSERQGPNLPVDLPVERVSWNDSQAYISKLNSSVGGAGFRLPTEAEWEYAARADGELLKDVELPRYAWFRETAAAENPPSDDFRRIEHFATQPVGRKEPNRWGFFDMQGNVWEWTSSLFQPYFYDPADGRESSSAAGERVLRGGAYSDPAFLLHPALRHSQRPTRRYRWNGLRLARTVPSETVD